MLSQVAIYQCCCQRLCCLNFEIIIFAGLPIIMSFPGFGPVCGIIIGMVTKQVINRYLITITVTFDSTKQNTR